ncbi:1-phosphofructokinase [Beutenbergia cavernae DSM 12333]|uniref:1-phosphofructokinase n=1 Tax=Beutenbergia cavernae (strain ATCC BAA-8 / DSM 12333 / CCUG 43141 / JCM 11478 / NBRC 16432 / NCIMB 13614 / HKI 0122) TaxID=471853 RepID=C5C2T5_BEUC1|nr:hexose kinase [Beutenbergia cavernae]ACQ81779.1 1-phosphofructokinase [Beutenbergia cavernae DSM 12333]
MIVTLTPNPALDVTYRVPGWRPGASHRVHDVTERAGGKGLNVARVLHALGVGVRAVAPLGGATGERVASDAAAAGLELLAVPIAGETRRSIAVTGDGDATVFNEAGPVLGAGEWAAVLAALDDVTGPGDVLVVSGSVPAGVGTRDVADLVTHLRERGTKVVLDTSGPALAAGLAAGPDVVKPNAHELVELVERAGPLPTLLSDDGGDATAVARAAVVDAARRVLTGDAAHTFAAVSLGAGGMVGVSADRAWWVAAPERLGGNPTGAGDAAVAALARGLDGGAGAHDALADAVALSGAAVVAPLAGDVDAATYERLRAAVVVHEMEDTDAAH